MCFDAAIVAYFAAVFLNLAQMCRSILLVESTNNVQFLNVYGDINLLCHMIKSNKALQDQWNFEKKERISLSGV